VLQNTTYDQEGNVFIQEDEFLYKFSHHEMLNIWRHVHYNQNADTLSPVRSYFDTLPLHKQQKITRCTMQKKT
jgi:hypothetical protein